MAAPAATVDTYPPRHHAGLAISLGSGIVGIAAALLLPLDVWGFGFPLAMLAIFGGSLMVKKKVGAQTKVDFLWIGVLLFSFLVAWRDSSELRSLNLAMVFLLAGVLAIRSQHGQIWSGSVYDYSLRAFGAWCVAFVDTSTCF